MKLLNYIKTNYRVQEAWRLGITILGISGMLFFTYELFTTASVWVAVALCFMFLVTIGITSQRSQDNQRYQMIIRARNLQLQGLNSQLDSIEERLNRVEETFRQATRVVTKGGIH